MNLKIEKITVGELGPFVKSEGYNNLSNVPISPSRAKSYIHNPNAKPTDLVLVLGFAGNKLVAYRSLFAGIVKTKNETIRFAWCSGNWVHPDFRRKGLSQKLLEVAYHNWDGKLMFTNYAPESLQLYLKTGWFYPIHQFHGVRAYLFPKTRKLVPMARNKKYYSPLFQVVDSGISFVAKFRSLFFNKKIKPGIRFECQFEPDKQCYDFLNSRQEDLLFNRDVNEMKWIFSYPWISKENRNIALKYQFTAFSDSFSYQVVKFYNQNIFAGFFILSIKEGHLKTLYYCVLPGFENKIAHYLKQVCVTQRIEMATIYNSAIASVLFKRKFPFLHLKKYGQKIYSTFRINEIEKYNIQDGDGDVIFT